MGKSYKIPSSLDRLRKHQIQIKELQALGRSRNTPKPVASTAFAGVSAAGSQGGTGNFLRTVGDTMIGPLALAPPVNFRVQIDSDGIIDIGESSDNSQYSSNIQLDDIQPNTFVLDTIGGSAFDGQILVIRTFAPSIPFTISQATLANGGNIQTLNDADFTVGDLKVMTFIFDASLLIFANTGGTWREISGDGTGGGASNIPDGTIENQHPEWNNVSNLWEAKVNLEFGATGPHADNGFLRFPNDTIWAAARTGANDGNIELKFTTQDELDLTNSNNSTVALLLRAQDAVDPDNRFLISQNPGIGGDAFLTTSNNLAILTNLTTQNVLFSPTLALFGTDISMDTNEIFLDADEDSGIVSIGDNNVQIFTNDIVRALFTNTNLELAVNLDMKTFDIFGIDRALFADSAGSFGSSSDMGLVRTVNGLARNVPTGDRHDWRIENELLMVLRQLDSNTIFELQANTGYIRQLNFRENIPNDGDNIYEWSALSQNLAGSPTNMADMFVEMEQNDTGNEAASILWRVRDVNLSNYMGFNINRDDHIRFFKNLIMDDVNDIELNSNVFYLETSLQGTRIEKDAAFDNIDFYVEGNANRIVTISNGGATIGTAGTNSLLTMNNFIRLVPTDAVATNNGTLWYDLSENKFKARENGSTVNLIGGGDMILSAVQTVTGAKTFGTTILKFRNPADTFSYTVLTGSILANRNLVLPTLIANDTLLGATTFSVIINKTMNADSNTFLDFGAAEIESGIITDQTLKAIPAAADSILISDSADAGDLKRITLTALLAGGSGNSINQGDSSVVVTDVGLGAINFSVDNTALGSITTTFGWVLENDLTLSSGDLLLFGNDILNFGFIESDAVDVPNNGAIRLGGDEGIHWDTGSTSEIKFTYDLNNGFFVFSGDTTDFVEPIILLQQTNTSPPASHVAGSIHFGSFDSLGEQIFDYGVISTTVLSNIAGAEETEMSFNVTVAGAGFQEFLTLNENQEGTVKLFRDLDMNQNNIRFDATTVPSDPPATELLLFSDSTNSNHLSIRRIGATVDLEAGGGGVTNPLTLNGTLATLPELILNRTDATADSQNVGKLTFQALDDASNPHEWAQIIGGIQDNNDTDAEGFLEFLVSTDTSNTLELFMTMDGDSADGGHSIAMEKDLIINSGIRNGIQLNDTINIISAPATLASIVIEPEATGNFEVRIDGSGRLIILPTLITMNSPLSLGGNLINNTAGIIPVVTDTHNLGTDALKYEEVHANNFLFDELTGIINSVTAGVLVQNANASGNVTLSTLDTGVAQLQLNSNAAIGFFGGIATRQTVTGGVGGSAALSSLLTALSNYGLIIDNST